MTADFISSHWTSAGPAADNNTIHHRITTTSSKSVSATYYGFPTVLSDSYLHGYTTLNLFFDNFYFRNLDPDNQQNLVN